MLDDLEKTLYCMIGDSNKEVDGCLTVVCHSGTVFTEKKLLEKMLETFSEKSGKEYKILEEIRNPSLEPDVLDEVVLVTNLPYHIYAEEILEYKNRTWNT